MATPVEPKQVKKDKDMRSRPWRERTIDPSVVSAEAPVPDVVTALATIASLKCTFGNDPDCDGCPMGEDERNCGCLELDQVSATITRLTAEVERLRAALEIAKHIALAMNGEPPIELVEELEKLATISTKNSLL